MEGLLSPTLLWGLIAVALAFDFLNGLHDAANSIATIVSTRVLKPHYAVAWAAFFNFIAFLFFGLHVAETVGRDGSGARVRGRAPQRRLGAELRRSLRRGGGEGRLPRRPDASQGNAGDDAAVTAL